MNKQQSNSGKSRSGSQGGPKRGPGGSRGSSKGGPKRFNGRSVGKRSRGGGGGRRGGGKKRPTFDPSQFINKNPVQVKEEVYAPTHTFKDFGFDDKLVETLDSMGIEIPSPIQDQSIEHVLNGQDVVGLAETGTGKTAAFLLPLIERTHHDMEMTTLILAPTRELAIQISDEFRKLSRRYRMYSTVCVGGMSIRPQLTGLRKKNHFIIGTPGRVMDLIQRNAIHPDKLNVVVLDEADRMLDMGFIGDMRTIMNKTPKDRQTLFFSATMNKSTELIIGEFLNDPVTISVKKKDVTNSIEQDVVRHGHNNKFETLLKLMKDDSFTRVIIFGAMKHSVQRLSDELRSNGITSEAIHGNKNHRQRQMALNSFKDGKARVLVATDVAARGIHVDDVSHVINYDLPQQFEDYVHRIGRTGRKDKKGMALTFIPDSRR